MNAIHRTTNLAIATNRVLLLRYDNLDTVCSHHVHNTKQPQSGLLAILNCIGGS